MSILEAEAIKQVDASHIADLFSSNRKGKNHVTATRMREIMFAAAGSVAGYCVQTTWETRAEQDMFNTMLAVIRASTIVKKG